MTGSRTRPLPPPALGPEPGDDHRTHSLNPLRSRPSSSAAKIVRQPAPASRPYGRLRGRPYGRALTPTPQSGALKHPAEKDKSKKTPPQTALDRPRSFRDDQAVSAFRSDGAINLRVTVIDRLVVHKQARIGHEGGLLHAIELHGDRGRSRKREGCSYGLVFGTGGVRGCCIWLERQPVGHRMPVAVRLISVSVSKQALSIGGGEGCGVGADLRVGGSHHRRSGRPSVFMTDET
jgi:hypothetical protein